MAKQTIQKITLRLESQSKPELAGWLNTSGSWLLEALGFKQGEEVSVVIGERLLVVECETVAQARERYISSMEQEVARRVESDKKLAQELKQNLKNLSSAIHDITGNQI